jgi:hypothetical protein
MRAHVCFDASACVHLIGQGRKERTVPLWHDTAQVLKAWFRELGDDARGLACPSASGKPLSRDEVDYLGVSYESVALYTFAGETRHDSGLGMMTSSRARHDGQMLLEGQETFHRARRRVPLGAGAVEAQAATPSLLRTPI